MPHAVVRRDDRVHPRCDVALEQHARDPAEADAQVLDALAVGHRDVGGDTHEQLVQREALRPERDDVARREAGQVRELLRVREGSRHVLGPEHGRERQQLDRNLRLDAGMPGTEGGIVVNGG